MLEILLYLLDIMLPFLTLMPILLMMELLLCSLDIALPVLPFRLSALDIMVKQVYKSSTGVS